jgi:uncharacterized repeat protein (TIGR03806 family)
MPHSPRWKKPGFVLSLCLAAAGLAALPGRTKSAAVPVGPYFNGIFPAEAPGSAPAFSTANAFPCLTFTDPVWIAEIPGTPDMVLVEKGGKLKRFPNDRRASPASLSVPLDLGSRLQVSEDQGVYQIAFHPDFAKAGSPHAADIFLTYSYRPSLAGAGPDASMWRLSRFRWPSAAGAIDPASESVLIQQYDPNRWHNGGAMAFDGEGFLLVTCGDGGGTDDQFGQSQSVEGGFFGGVFRIDVGNDLSRSHPIRRQPSEPRGKPKGFPPSFTQGYSIPNDNPWLDPEGRYLEETYAIGLRSPHSASYDPATGDLWVGDVGRTDREELNLVRKSANLQWPFMEGDVPGPKAKDIVRGVETPPAYAYDRSMGGCIIGGMCYRGARWADALGGMVLFGDNLKGTLHAWQPTEAGVRPAAREILSSLGAGIYSGLANLCTDSAGEIYLLKLNGRNRDGGSVRMLVPGKPGIAAPALLSATGLFSDTIGLEPSASLVSYEVASPSWSDGAIKSRWIALPNDGNRDSDGERIAYSAEGNWTFPAGTVFVKHFDVRTDERNPSAVKRMETRVIVCTDHGGKYGLTYRWNEEGTDAFLLTDGAQADYTLTRADGSAVSFKWSFPAAGECFLCHTDLSGQALGLRTRQISRSVARPESAKPHNQLALFNSQGMFRRTLGAADLANVLEARALGDESAPLEHRVRSYLDVNCSHCHQPGGSVDYFDARLQTPLQAQGIVNVPLKGQYRLKGGRYLAPGDPAASAVYTRMATCAPGISMPPLGHHRVDETAASLLAEYIRGLDCRSNSPSPRPLARYLCFTAPVGEDGYAAIAELAVLDNHDEPFPQAEISIAGVNGEEIPGHSRHLIDGDPATFWSSSKLPGSSVSITLDLATPRVVGGFEYVPRQDSASGRLRSYQVHRSMDGIDWTLMVEGSIATATGPVTAVHRFEGPSETRPPACTLAAAALSDRREFPVTITFDTEVTGFEVSDIHVSGGRVKSLRGHGYYYVATVFSDKPRVSISVPAGAAATPAHGNTESNTVEVAIPKNTGFRFRSEPEP